MRKFYLAIAASLLVSTAGQAAPIIGWSGAGPNACFGRCSLEWAETQLTPAQHAELKEAQLERPYPQTLVIGDGELFEAMAFYKDGQAYMDRNNRFANVPEGAGAQGWRLNGWSFVKMNACDNWSIVRGNVGNTGLNNSNNTKKNGGAGGAGQDDGTGKNDNGGLFTELDLSTDTTITRTVIVTKMPAKTVTTVPLPAGLFLFLTGIGVLFLPGFRR